MDDVKKPHEGPSEGDYHLMYSTAHHDLWWAKGSLWSATSWALALMGVVVGATALVDNPLPIAPMVAWPFLALASAVAAGTAFYLARLQYDIVRARINVAFIRKKRPQLKDLFMLLPKHGDVSDDAFRGVEFVITLLGMLAVGVGLAVYIITRNPYLPIIFGLGLLSLGLIFIIYWIRRALNETKHPSE